MIKRWFKQLIFNRIAIEIEKAANSTTYREYQFLCSVLGFDTWHPFKYLARELITTNLGKRSTLGSLIRSRLFHGQYDISVISHYDMLNWDERIVYHRAYWAKMVEQLRVGNPTWGSNFSLEEIGFGSPTGTLADRILDQLRKDIT